MLKCLSPGEGHHWRIVARCDWEDYFCTDEFDYHFDTTDIEAVAKRVKEIIGKLYYTIF